MPYGGRNKGNLVRRVKSYIYITKRPPIVIVRNLLSFSLLRGVGSDSLAFGVLGYIRAYVTQNIYSWGALPSLP